MTRHFPHLWKLMNQYRVQKSPSLCHMQSQINPAYNLIVYSSEIRFNIIFPSIRISPTWSRLLMFADENFLRISHSRACYMSSPSNIPSFNQLNNMVF
jgi:hypothetical protein